VSQRISSRLMALTAKIAAGTAIPTWSKAAMKSPASVGGREGPGFHSEMAARGALAHFAIPVWMMSVDRFPWRVISLTEIADTDP